MKTIFPLSLITLIFAALPVDASLTVSEGVKLQGSILTVKSTKKYTSVSVKIIAKDPDLIINNYKKVANKIENVILL